MRDADCVAFLQWALPRLKMRWQGFRRVRRQVCRRIKKRIKELNLETLGQYQERLVKDRNEWKILDAACQITISRFYRNRHVFDVLASDVLPAIFTSADKQHRSVRCWCAGCASGEEPYTLAIIYGVLLCPIFPGIEFDIIATDGNPTIIARARQARYGSGSVRDLPHEWVDRAFAQHSDQFSLLEAYRQCVTIRQEDIRDKMPDGPFDLVLCRYLVFTYFDVESQLAILEHIKTRIRPGGYLIIGAHEMLPRGCHGFRALSACPSVLQLAKS